MEGQPQAEVTRGDCDSGRHQWGYTGHILLDAKVPLSLGQGKGSGVTASSGPGSLGETHAQGHLTRTFLSVSRA